MRLRLRFSLFSILSMLTALCLLIFYGLLWTTHKPGYDEPMRGVGGDVPFMLALSHQNIYDLYSPPEPIIFKESSDATKKRIEELYYLVRDAHAKQLNKPNLKKLFPLDDEWNVQPLIDRKNAILALEPDSDEEDDDDADTNATTTTTTPRPTTVTPRTTKIFSEQEREKIRNHVLHLLYKWKKDHEHDKVVSLADLMYDKIVKSDPS